MRGLLHVVQKCRVHVVGVDLVDSADVHVCVVRRSVVWWKVGSLQ